MARSVLLAYVLAILAMSQVALASFYPQAVAASRKKPVRTSVAKPASIVPPSVNGTEGAGAGNAPYARVCAQIASAISSSSAVYNPGNPVFTWLSQHWASSSSEPASCVVEPRNNDDIAKILQIVGRSRTPFAVKSGGHATNVKFSSTRGVIIHMNSYQQVNYNAGAGTVELGAGIKWADVYTALEPHGVMVTGGRVNGPAVGGLTIGGGYSWKSNHFGLTVDTVTAFELIKPDGKVVTVTQSSDPELFFGLKGGGNNFGIVTKITFKTHPQGQVWGGSQVFRNPDTWPAVRAATAKFSAEVTDPKAALVTIFTYQDGEPFISTLLFYDEPTQPAGIFDDFLAIPADVSDISTQRFVTYVEKALNNDTYGNRGTFHTLPVPIYSEEFLKVVEDLTAEAGNALKDKSLEFLALVPEPFLPSILSHNDVPTAYPWTREKTFTPFNIFFSWTDPAQDQAIYEVIERVTNSFYDALVGAGLTDVTDAPLYNNYALPNTPIERLYGSNLPALRRLKSRIDPGKVMDLAGGFKF